MVRKANHSLLDNAKANKKDEFYTQLSDIERELRFYKKHFKDKIVFCNCDDARISNFYKYFVQNFKQLGLKRLICACCKKTEPAFYYEYADNGKRNPTLKDVSFFKGDGDFRSGESVELLKKADIVVTNPPFSLFREYISQLDGYGKKFLIVGNINAITYKEVFALIKENKAWMGVNMGRGISGFIVPEHYELYGLETKINDAGERIVSPNNCMWLTNLDNARRHEFIPLTKEYRGNENAYPRFDNCDAINVNKTQDIPMDYKGIMGGPITFLHKFNPEQFKIVKFRKGDDDRDLAINGKPTYFRILIQGR